MPRVSVDFKIQRKSGKTLKWHLQRKTEEAAAPDEDVLQKYYRYVEHSYLRALQMQLEYSDGKGYATGRLHRSIRVWMKKGQGTRWSNGQRISVLDMGQEMENYGRNIAEGRAAAGIDSDILVAWIKQKINNGTLRASPDTDSEIDRMAFWINRHKKDGVMGKATLPYWNRYDKSVDLRNDFKKIYNRSKGRHVKALSDSIIKNIRKADYGKHN